jgi:hypothetical protein
MNKKSLIPRFFLRALIIVVPLFLLIAPSVVTGGDSVMLVTEEQAGLDNARGIVEEVDDGPTIKIKSPENGSILTGPFRLYVEITKKAGGANVNMKTLKVNYLKMITINITSKVKDYIKGNKVDVPNAEFPVGNHRTEIYIEDVDGNVSRKLFTVTVGE